MRALLLLAAACTAGAPGDDDTDDGADTDDTDVEVASTCTEAPGQVGAFLADLDVSGTEGLALEPSGAVWVVGSDRVWRIEGGEAEQVGFAPKGVGATWWKDEAWVAVWEDGGGSPAPALLAFQPDGSSRRVATPTINKPNFLLPTPWGTLLVSDDFDTRIFELDGDAVTVWAEDVPSPNGMGFSPDGRTLWVASTFTEPGLSAIAIEGEAAGARDQVVAFDVGTTPDGLAVAANGDVFVALNLAGEIVAWDGEGTSTLTASIPTPASLAFGLGAGGLDPCTLVVTSLFDDTVWQVSSPIQGPGLP